MDWQSLSNAGPLFAFLLVLARVGGLVMTAPVLGTKVVPVQVRLLLAAAVAMVVAPCRWGAPLPRPDNLAACAALVGSELLIGLCLGLGVTVLFSGAQLAGGLIGRVGGLTVADVFDPNVDEDVPMLSQLMLYAALAVFLSIGGHRVVVAALLDTFEAIPPGGAAVPRSIAEVFAAIAGQSFLLGLRAAIPAVAALLIATLAIALVGRAVPQLNILTLGFGVNAMLTLAAVSLTLGAAAWLFQDQVGPTLEMILEACGA
jgi:flagellar biosynthetic protein FliR